MPLWGHHASRPAPKLSLGRIAVSPQSLRKGRGCPRLDEGGVRRSSRHYVSRYTLVHRAPWGKWRLRAFEPILTEVLAAAPLLAAFYNDSHNFAMLTNTRELTAAEVVETFQSMRATGDRPFLLEQDGELMGDGDFRHIEGLGRNSLS